MKIATYNVEWFHRLFARDGTLLEDDRWSARYNVTRAQQLQALAHVFRAMDADGIMVIEAPDSDETRDGCVALENFAARFGLRTRAAISGFVNDTKQEIIFLYDPDLITAQHGPQASPEAPRFDGVRDGVRWSKPPLELAVQGQGHELRLIGVHAKSKAAHGAEDAHDARRIALANRRKQMAQCRWLRARVDDHLSAGQALMVMGDFNDGPGLDQYEAQFGQSSVETVLGEGARRLIEPHAYAALAQRLGGSPSTARFYVSQGPRYMQALLDYIMLSRDLADGASWRIWHPFDDYQCWHDDDLREALLAASDHFPVCVEIPSKAPVSKS